MNDGLGLFDAAKLGNLLEPALLGDWCCRWANCSDQRWISLGWRNLSEFRRSVVMEGA